MAASRSARFSVLGLALGLGLQVIGERARAQVTGGMDTFLSGAGWAIETGSGLAQDPRLDRGPFLAQAPGAQRPAAPAAAGQAPVPAAGGRPGEWYWRVGFLTIDQWAYRTHPFAQITGASPFDNGRAAAGGTLGASAPESDSSSFVLVQVLHSLPPFSVEVGQPLDQFLPKGFSLGFDYFAFSQDGSSAGTGGTVPPIKVDSYVYQFTLRGFAFDPTQPGLNYYLGLGAGYLQGKLTAQPYVGQSPKVIDFSQPLTGSSVFGVEAKGDNFGLRYELNLISASQVKLDSNPYPNSGKTTIDFSGTITRFAIFYQF